MSWLSRWTKRGRRRLARRSSAAAVPAPPAPERSTPAATAAAPAAPAPDPSWQAIFERFAPPQEATAERLLASAENDMERLFYGPRDRVVMKWHHYLAVYDRYLARFRGTPVRLLEIGVNRGGSLQLWRDYLGAAAVIHGIDIDPRCAQIDDPGLTVHIGDQADQALLDEVFRAMGGIDVVIDDGSHVSSHQIATFLALFPKLSDGGVYICEDLHASYWRRFGGGLGRQGTFIEFLKERIDGLHAHYFEAADAGGTPPLAGLYALSIYDSIAVVEKRREEAPFWIESGRRALPETGTG